jgi:hypothetical protein
MSKPGIPLDIVEAARAVYAKLGRGSTADEAVIAQALAAERERCAAVPADLVRAGFALPGEGTFADLVAGTIRQGGAS